MPRFAVTIFLLLLMAVPAEAAGKKPKKTLTEDQKALYAVGLVIARQLETFALSRAELELVKKGMTDGVYGRKPLVDYGVYSKKSVELGIARRDAHGRKLAEKAAAYMEQAAQEPGAVRTKSGLIFKSLSEGIGEHPSEANRVKLQFRATLIDGTEVISTFKDSGPEIAPLNTFLPCLTEAVQLMKTGGKAKLVCPPELALANEGSGGIPPNATLVFEVELMEIM